MSFENCSDRQYVVIDIRKLRCNVLPKHAIRIRAAWAHFQDRAQRFGALRPSVSGVSSSGQGTKLRLPLLAAELNFDR